MAFVTMMENGQGHGSAAVAGKGAHGLGLTVAKSRGSRFGAQRKCPHLGFGVCRGSFEHGKLTCELHRA